MDTIDHTEEQMSAADTNIDDSVDPEYDHATGLEAINYSLESLTAVVSAFHGSIVGHMNEAHAIMRDAAELHAAMESKQTEEQTRLQQAMAYIESFQKRMFAEYEEEDEDEEADQEAGAKMGSATSTPCSSSISSSCNSSRDSGIMVNFNDTKDTNRPVAALI